MVLFRNHVHVRYFNGLGHSMNIPVNRPPDQAGDDQRASITEDDTSMRHKRHTASLDPRFAAASFLVLATAMNWGEVYV